jgi:hypothetical protein
VCQVDAVHEAIDLSAADTWLWWNLSEKYLTYDQACARIKRYRDKRTLQYDYLIPEGTAIELAYESLQAKEDVAHYMVSNPSAVERIIGKYAEGTTHPKTRGTK